MSTLTEYNLKNVIYWVTVDITHNSVNPNHVYKQQALKKTFKCLNEMSKVFSV